MLFFLEVVEGTPRHVPDLVKKGGEQVRLGKHHAPLLFPLQTLIWYARHVLWSAGAPFRTRAVAAEAGSQGRVAWQERLVLPLPIQPGEPSMVMPNSTSQGHRGPVRHLPAAQTNTPCRVWPGLAISFKALFNL